MTPKALLLTEWGFFVPSIPRQHLDMAIELKLGEDGVYDDNTIWLEDGVTKFVEYPKVVLDRIANSQEEEEQILLAAGHAANEIEVIEEAEFEVIPLELQEPDGIANSQEEEEQILLAAGHAANEIEVIEEAEFEVIPLELQEPDGTTDIRKTRKARH